MFFTLVLLVNIYFFAKIEPNELKNQMDRLLALFLFQFDYFFLFVYIFSKLLKNFKKPLVLLAICYGGLFCIGLSSFIIVDEKEFDVVYSYVQPTLRLLLAGVFFEMGIKKLALSDTRNILLATFGLTGGLYFLYLLNLHPRTPMLSFNLYWVGIMAFLFAGIQLRVHQNNVRVLFLVGLFFTVTADLYYILPPEERVYELTYIFIRVINTIGEFLIVNHVLRFYAFKSRENL
ncbi:hypothetical protein GCM10011514_29210 [Emticicia aquatilis]|uniref:Uncharacterized protein n=2 Tax=Emticicia aquatilis TaxID=1537369 RepID=A0A916YVT0_9BACT|nr:hypothetical protein GCM10011514_29210 [Emticicia aquatilis]